MRSVLQNAPSCPHRTIQHEKTKTPHTGLRFLCGKLVDGTFLKRHEVNLMPGVDDSKSDDMLAGCSFSELPVDTDGYSTA